MKYILFIACTLSAFNLHAQAINNKESAPNTDAIAFRYVEQMPEPTFNMNGYLAANITYPKQAKKNNIEGRVYINFIVTAQGEITDVKSMKEPIGYGLEEEAIRVIKAMPKWKPGKQNGKPVDVYFTQPITFKLTD